MLKNSLKRSNRQKGATLVEYSLLVALIAIASVFAIKAIGVNLQAIFTDTANTLAEQHNNNVGG